MARQFDIAADLDTPVSAYLKLAPFDPRFLLESVEGAERLARYSFIGLGSAFELRIADDRLSIDGQDRPAPTDRESLLAELRNAVSRAPVLSATPTGSGGLSAGTRDGSAPPVPFTGGLVGAAGFELMRRFERLDTPAPEPGTSEASYLAPRSVIVFDHLSRRAALLHEGPEEERVSLRREIVRALAGPLPDRFAGGKASAPAARFERTEFLSAVARAKGHITAGDVFQLVLSIRYGGETEVPPFEVYRALRLLNPSPYMYFLDLGDSCVAGSSPEALVRLEGRQAALRPIAGTRPRGADPEQDLEFERELLADPKENAEHVMLVDLARNDLGRVAVPGTIRVDPYKSIERYSHVMHMVSGTTGLLEPERDALDLFAATFPAGTVVGAPKIRAMQLISDLEPCSRGFYAGTVGYFGAGGS
ncbi:MAG: anthranilate synthase component I family protein, partial [Gemmatimonadota bacterium]